MPRDLFPPQEPVITQSPDTDDGARDSSGLSVNMGGGEPVDYDYAVIGGDDLDGRELELSNAFQRDDDLHPYVQSLSISDLDACVALEIASFPEQERCSKEKFQYRLTVCPELSLGVFSSTANPSSAESKSAFAAARAPDSTRPAHKTLLIGQVIATMTTAERVTDASMEIPLSFEASESNQQPPDSSADASSAGQTSDDTEKPPPVPSKDPPPPPPKQPAAGLPQADEAEALPGHHSTGRTIAIHSICVLPQFQGSGLGKMLLRSYLQRMETSGIADRAVLLAHPHLIPFYTDNFGFETKGESKVTFGGGGWHDLVYDFNESGFWS